MPKHPRPLVMAARIHGGQLKLSGKPVWREALSRWPDGPVDVEIRYREDTRRARANRYMWGVVLKLMAYEMGETHGATYRTTIVCANGHTWFSEPVLKWFDKPFTGPPILGGKR